MPYFVLGEEIVTEDKYFASSEQDEIELERLGLLHQIFDPYTIENMEAIGITESWRCLDVGAGAGSIASWMSDCVGSSGSVVATDINLRFLNQLNKPNLEVRQHNIVNDDIENNSYNLVHCRFLLMHLNEYKIALRKMAEAVKPGGWLLIEELDYCTAYANDESNPRVVSFNDNTRRLRASLIENGVSNVYFGRHVRSLIDEIGFTEVNSKGIIQTYRGGELYARWTLATGKTAVQQNLNLTEDEETTKRKATTILVYSDPSFYLTSPIFYSAWGRKPK